VEEDTIQAETEWAVRRKRYRLRLSGPCAREKSRERGRQPRQERKGRAGRAGKRGERGRNVRCQQQILAKTDGGTVGEDAMVGRSLEKFSKFYQFSKWT
jgi:hypothetical protein